MGLHIQLNEVQIKISGENNEKLSRIIEHPLLRTIEVNKKLFVNKLIENYSDDELVSLFRKSIGFDQDRS